MGARRKGGGVKVRWCVCVFFFFFYPGLQVQLLASLHREKRILKMHNFYSHPPLWPSLVVSHGILTPKKAFFVVLFTKYLELNHQGPGFLTLLNLRLLNKPG